MVEDDSKAPLRRTFFQQSTVENKAHLHKPGSSRSKDARHRRSNPKSRRSCISESAFLQASNSTRKDAHAKTLRRGWSRRDMRSTRRRRAIGATRTCGQHSGDAQSARQGRAVGTTGTRGARTEEHGQTRAIELRDAGGCSETDASNASERMQTEHERRCERSMSGEAGDAGEGT